MSKSLPFKLLLGASVLLGGQLQAHFDKNFDRNGGHFDDWGNYHCHQGGCRPHASRNSFGMAARTPLSNRDDDLYYLEEDWPRWEIFSGCKTVRTAVLENTSRVPVTWTNPRQCEIREGLWLDEYTGKEYTRAAQLEIDHIISPVYANAANGWTWDNQKRAQFSNDPLNLIPVSRQIHDKKRDRGIGRWRPRDEFLCDYAQNWKDVSEKYELDLFAQDRSRMNKILDECDTSSRQGIEEND